jgi:methyl-accepting chemotaxis protein
MPWFRFPYLKFSSRTTWRGWMDHLHHDGRALHELSSTTEGEFIQIGESLQDFYRRAGEISRLASSVAERISGGEMARARRELQSVFDEVKQQGETSRKGVVGLSSLLEASDNIRNQLDGFDKTVKNLRMLCNYIRIESASLGERNEGFDALSDDVKKLGSSVASKSTDLASRSSSISALIRQHLEMAAGYSSHQKEQERMILNRAEQNLSALTDRYQQSSVTLREIADRWVHISKNIGEVVSSLQFHDITRQRLEHAGEALAELVTDATGFVRSGDASGAPPRWAGGKGLLSKRAATLFAPCEIQVAQLRHAQADLTAAVLRMNTNLREIAADSVGMSQEIRKLAGNANGENCSFLSELEKELSSLLAAMSDFMEINRECAASIARVQATVVDMSLFIKDIEVIGIEMRMIALNACVRAARIGNDGMVLGVLAEAIHQLSVDTTQQIEAVSGSLAAISAEAGSLSADVEHRRFQQGQNRKEAMTDHVRGLLAPLCLMDEEISVLLNRIETSGSELSEEIERTVLGNTVQERMGRGIGEVVAELDRLIREMRDIVPKTEQEKQRRDLAALAERYTMEQERLVHQAVAASVPMLAGASSSAHGEVMNGGPEKTLAAGTATSKEELGDNVELF